MGLAANTHEKSVRLVTLAGPPSTGKTSVAVRALERLTEQGLSVGVVKFDALSSTDDALYRKAGIRAVVGLSEGVCPDHFFVTNIDDALSWARREGLDLLVAETAGLCNRCSPHIRGVLGVCVIDVLAGVHTPNKVGPMLRLADVVVVTKGDIVSQAEREVFFHYVRRANPRARTLAVNGITGQGGGELARLFREAAGTAGLEGARLRFPMPSAVCPYCIGETCIGEDHQRGNVRKIELCEAP